MQEKDARHVIAKERSDCGNLNPYGIKTVYFLRRPEGPRQSLAFRAEVGSHALDIGFVFADLPIACILVIL
jgi:hypothetical protein